MTAVLACGIFVVTYALIATERIHRVAAALGGVAAMALVGVVDTQTASYSEDSGVAHGAPIVEDLANAAPTVEQGESLWWAFALGADIGGNTTAVTAGANVVIIGIAAGHLHPISFWRFTTYGLAVTVFTLILAWPYVWLRYPFRRSRERR